MESHGTPWYCLRKASLQTADIKLRANSDKSEPCSLCCVLMLHRQRVCVQCLWYQGDPQSTGLLSAYTHAEHFALQLHSTGCSQSSRQCSGLESTKSHYYLDYVRGPPTHAACPRYSKVGCLQRADPWGSTLWHCVWVTTKEGCRCVMPVWRKWDVHGCLQVCVCVCVSQQHSVVVRAVPGSGVGWGGVNVQPDTSPVPAGGSTTHQLLPGHSQ